MQRELVREFLEHYHRLPFANLPEDDAREDAEERGEEDAGEDVT